MITERRLARMREVLERRHDDLVVVLENIHDAHNASAILRSCDAFGVGRVALVYTNQVFPEISGGVAAKVPKWLQIDRFASAEDCVSALHDEGIKVYATELTDDAHDYLGVDFGGPCAIVLGNEHAGCSAEMVALADGAVIVPMAGFVQSLNVSVAAAVILAEIARQRREFQPGWSERKAAQLQRWIERESSRADSPGVV
ncbi:MAG: RNA methyltransferase [Chloroflexi bacterium]|nr:RNA methyltransferase [Chloroflexota bacterium]MCY3571933.1 RNA methyltransferase [Chloroflexota bacterium]MCY3686565.1 RNA methyltransferase [Chloroflexota bacterium]MCY3695825.1 RNA methyltransferase [Chloroflexota bacterium]